MRLRGLGGPLRGAWSGARRAPGPALVVLGLVLLALAWCFGPTPFGAPDETAHYVRALELGGGELVGEVAHLDYPPLTPTQRAWVAQAEREVDIPPGLFPVTNCGLADIQRPPTCIDDAEPVTTAATYVTATGTYDPAPYVLPGLVMRLAGGSLAALWLGRLTMAAQTLALVGAAVLVVGRRYGGTAVLGVVVGLTPTVLATFSSLNPSAVEIAAGVALGAALLALEPDRRAAWALAAVAALALCLARSSGIAWAGGLLALAALWHGPRQALALARARRLEAAVLALAVLVGGLGSQVWARLYGPAVDVVRPTSEQLGDWFEFFALTVYQQAIGWFGHYDLQLSPVSYWAYAIALVVLGVAGLLLGRGPRRLLFALAVAVLLTTPAVLYLAIVEQTGFGPQARHVLPALTVLPLMAGILLADAERLPGAVRAVATWLIGGGVALVVGAVQLQAWWESAHRTAVGIGGPWLFVGRGAWSPLGGWAVWAACAFLGTVILVGGLLLGLRRAAETPADQPTDGPAAERAPAAEPAYRRATTVADA